LAGNSTGHSSNETILTLCTSKKTMHKLWAQRRIAICPKALPVSIQQSIVQSEPSAIGSLGDIHHPIILTTCVADFWAIMEMPTDVILGKKILVSSTHITVNRIKEGLTMLSIVTARSNNTVICWSKQIWWNLKNVSIAVAGQ
jgi:hypothetical protein